MKLYEVSQAVITREIIDALNRKEDFDLAIRRDANSEKCLPLEVCYSETADIWTVAVNRSNTGNMGSTVFDSPDALMVAGFLRGVAVGIAWGRSDYYRVAHHSEI